MGMVEGAAAAPLKQRQQSAGRVTRTTRKHRRAAWLLGVVLTAATAGAFLLHLATGRTTTLPSADRRAHLAVADLRSVDPAHRIRVIDGDTIVIGRRHIRIFGMDAPETAQQCDVDGRDVACGIIATRQLVAMIGNADVVCTPHDQDIYGRTVAVCRVGNRDLGRAMVVAGWAVAFRRYSAVYLAEENDARVHRRGMWQGYFQPPEQWRLDHPH